jgi:hypothetical protein
MLLIVLLDVIQYLIITSHFTSHTIYKTISNKVAKCLAKLKMATSVHCSIKNVAQIALP